MKPRSLLMLLVGLLLALVASAAGTEWKIESLRVEGPSGRVLFLDPVVTIHADDQSELSFSAWGDCIHIDVEVRDSAGTKLVEVIGTGPAPAFQRTLHLKKKESRSLRAFTSAFSVSRSGSFTATGRVRAWAGDGSLVVLDLPKISFCAEVREEGPTLRVVFARSEAER